MKHILQISGPSGSEKEVLDPTEDPMVAYEEAVENAHYGDTITPVSYTHLRAHET